MHIDHFNISVPATLMEQVKDFYCDVFDLNIGKRPNFSRPGYWCYHDDKPLVHLIQSDQHFANEKQGYLDHIAFQLTGLTAFIGRLEKMGITYRVSNLKEIGMTQLFFKDPAGVGLEANFVAESL